MESTPIHLRHITVACVKCKKDINGAQYSTKDGWVCTKCQDNIIKEQSI